MLNNVSNVDVSIGSVVVVNYEDKNDVFTEEAVLVDNYVIDRLVPRIEAGCFRGAYKEEELFVFETSKTKRFVLTKDEFIDYKKNIFISYKKMNYQKLEVGKRVKLIADIYGVPNMKDVKYGVFGSISSIYQNVGDIKMASIVVKDSEAKKEIHVPLVNCIAIGK